MKSLIRTRFIDESWGSTDLDAVADFWLQLYESLHGESGFPRVPDQSLEIRLTGFPRSAGPVMAKELERRIAGTDLADARVSLTDPDTLVLSFPRSPCDLAPPRGLGVGLFTGAFEGLIAEFRYKVDGRAGRIVNWLRFASTLVIIGELHDGGLLVKSTWRTGSAGWEDANFRGETPPDEAAFLKAFAEFRASGAIPAKRIARRFFRPGDTDRITAWMVRGILVPFDRNRLPGLLLRVVVFASVILAFAWPLQWLIDNRQWMWIVPVVSMMLLPMMTIGFFFLNEYRIWFHGRARMRRIYDRHFEGRQLARLSAQEVGAFATDPDVRKLALDLRDAGFTPFGDLGFKRQDDVEVASQVFAAPDGATYFSLNCVPFIDATPELRFHIWPMIVLMEAQTWFPDGGHVESTSISNTYWRARPGPGTWLRNVAGIDDPIAFLRDHAAAAAAFAAERGLAPLRHERFEDFVRRQERLHEEERQQYLDHPYGWADHIRWYLQLPRNELRG